MKKLTKSEIIQGLYIVKSLFKVDFDTNKKYSRKEWLSVINQYLKTDFK